MSMRALQSALLLTSSLVAPTLAGAATVGNPLCPGEEVSFNPGNGEDIVVPDGFAVSVLPRDSISQLGSLSAAILSGLRCTCSNPAPSRPAAAMMGRLRRRTGSPATLSL